MVTGVQTCALPISDQPMLAVPLPPVAHTRTTVELTSAAPGPSGLHPATLLQFLAAHPECNVPTHLYFSSLLECMPPDLAAVSALGLVKPNGSIRPIGIPEALTKLWEKWLLATYRSTHSEHDFSSTQRGALHFAAAADGARALGLAVVELDVIAAYDRVPHARLYPAADRLGWPAQVANAVVALYSKRVIVTTDDTLLPPPGVGITQGSTLAPLLFASLAGHAAELVTNPHVTCISYLDNFIIFGAPTHMQSAIDAVQSAMNMPLLGVSSTHAGFTVASTPIPGVYKTPMGLSPERSAKRLCKAASTVANAKMIPPQSGSRLIASVALPSGKYAASFGIDSSPTDVLCVRAMSSLFDLSPDVVYLPRALGGLGCVPNSVFRDQDVLTAGRGMLHTKGLAGDIAARFAGPRAGAFWQCFADALLRQGGTMDANGSLNSFPDIALVSTAELNRLYLEAKASNPLRDNAMFLHPSLTAYTFTGSQPVARLPDHLGALAAELATLGSHIPTAVCPLCGKPESVGQAGHHRRCGHVRGLRSDGHHAIVRTLTSFVSDTNGLCGSSVMDHSSNLIPDITIHGLDGSPLPYYIEVKTSECRGESFEKWAHDIRVGATVKYSGLATKVHVLTIAHDGRVDAPSLSIIRKLQGARRTLGLRHPSDVSQIALTSLLGHQLVLAEAAIKKAYDTQVTLKLQH